MPAVLNPDTIINYKERDLNLFFKKKNDFYTKAINGFMHAVVPAVSFDHIKPSIVNSLYFHNTKNFVILLAKFNAYCDLDPEYDYEELKEKFIKISSFIAELSPQEISFSLINEFSTFFTFKIKEFEIHLNYYFDYDHLDIDDDEVVFTYYVRGEKKESFGGSFGDAINKMKTILDEETPLPIIYFSQSI